MCLLLLCGSLGGTFLITTNVIDYCIIINLRFVWTIFRVILQQPDHGELFRIWTFLVWSVCSALTSLQQRGPYSTPKFSLASPEVRSISDLDSKTGDRCRDGNRCAGCCHIICLLEGPVVVGWVSGLGVWRGEHTSQPNTSLSSEGFLDISYIYYIDICQPEPQN